MSRSAKSFSHPIMELQKTDLKISGPQLPRLKMLFTHEELSQWTSLMARYLPLGPSDVPCPMELSTAHDKPSNGKSFVSKGQANFHGVFASLFVHERIWLLSSRPSPDFRRVESPVQTFPPSSFSRGGRALTQPTKPKLGFSLTGLIHKLGPITLVKSKPTKTDAEPIAIKPRSGPITLLSSFKKRLCYFHRLTGRGLQLRVKPHPLIKLCNIFLRILVLVSSVVMPFESKSLKIYNSLLSIPICRNVDCCHGSSMPNCLSRIFLVEDFKCCPSYITPKIWNQYSQEDFDDMLVPARCTSLSLSSTSLRLLTVTIMSSTDPSMEELSTNRDLTCVIMLYSLCLKALMEPMSNYLIYGLMALGNASLTYVLNLVIFESLTFVLGLI